MMAIRNERGQVNPLFTDQAWFAAMIGAGIFAIVVIGVVIASYFFDISESGWQYVSSIARWYVGIMSGWVMFNALPMFIAGGHTRKAAFQAAMVTSGAIVLVGAAVLSLGYLVERQIYRLFDIEHSVDTELLAGNVNQIYASLPHFALIFLVWAAVGSMVGAAVYRDSDNGWLTILPAALFISIANVLNDTGVGFMAFITRIIPGWSTDSIALNVIVCLAVTAVAGTLAWLFARDVPMRNRPA